MRRTRPLSRAGGFTLIELLVIIAIVMVLALFTWPALDKMIQRSRLLGFANEMAALMQRARLEAVKRSVPSVVRLDFETDEVVVFIDVDDDGVFTPDSTVPLGEADFELLRRPKSAHVAFAGPVGGVEGTDTVDGFSPNPENSDLPNQAVFNPNGSIDALGSFRFSDVKGNVLEVRVAPQATARIELRKWDGSAFHAQREGGKAWEWNV